MTETRWLNDDERQAWLRLMAVTMLLPSRLEAELKRDAGLSHFEYYVLAMISEAPGRSSPLSTYPILLALPSWSPATRTSSSSLAGTVNASRSTSP